MWLVDFLPFAFWVFSFSDLRLWFFPSYWYIFEFIGILFLSADHAAADVNHSSFPLS
jgi:hypothetical protein